MPNPVDVVERLIKENQWPYNRKSEDELNIVVEGHNTNYHLAFTWMSDIQVLHLACAFELEIPAERVEETRTLLCIINEQLWIGHFDLLLGEDMVMHRYALILKGGAVISSKQCDAIIGSAFHACDQYHSAFQFVLAGKTAREALDAAMMETKGSA